MGEHKTWLNFSPGHVASTEGVADIAINVWNEVSCDFNWFSWKGHETHTRPSSNTQEICLRSNVTQSVSLTVINLYQAGEAQRETLPPLLTFINDAPNSNSYQISALRGMSVNETA